MIKVLIVDDEALMRQATSKIVSSLDGFDGSLLACNGQQAVDICKRQDIDIVFMDIMMPVKDGITASKEILEISPKTKIFILSSYNSFELAHHALRNKIEHYIIKPLDEEKILRVLTNYYNKINTKKDVQANVGIEKFIEANDFKSICRELNNFSKKLIDIYSEDDFSNETYRFMYNLLISFLPEHKNRYEDFKSKFVLENNADNDVRVLSTWLFNIIEYIFIVRSQNRYPILKNVFEYIQSNIKSYISLDNVVKSCNVSQGYLSRILKKEFNMTVMNYIHLKKINIAKEYICVSRMSISDVFVKVGYSEFSYFCKVFKKYEENTVSNFKSNIGII